MKKITPFLFLLTTLLNYSQEKIKLEPVLQDIIKQFPMVRDFTTSPMQDEIYFTVQGYSEELSTIIKVIKNDGIWSVPGIAPFSGQFRDMEAMFSPDGLKLFFVSNRPLKDTDTIIKDYDIWYIERSRISANWSAPKNIGSPINTDEDEFYPSVAKNGNLYFTSTAITKTKGKDDIFVSEFKNNQYTDPKSLSIAINSDGYEYNSYITPDESFIIFGAYKRKDGLGSGDLYISYKDNQGNWSIAKNLGNEINSDKMDYCPFYNTKNQTLYFTSKRNAIQETTESSRDLKQLLQTMNSYENGLSRIYSVLLRL